MLPYLWHAKQYSYKQTWRRTDSNGPSCHGPGRFRIRSDQISLRLTDQCSSTLVHTVRERYLNLVNTVQTNKMFIVLLPHKRMHDFDRGVFCWFQIGVESRLRIRALTNSVLIILLGQKGAISCCTSLNKFVLQYLCHSDSNDNLVREPRTKRSAVAQVNNSTRLAIWSVSCKQDIYSPSVFIFFLFFLILHSRFLTI
jgi:hypothetical protein